MATGVAFCIYQLIFQTKIYLQKLQNYYSGETVLNGKNLSYIVYYYFGYFILAAFDFCFGNPNTDAFFMIINTIIFIAFVIFIFNLQNTYIQVAQIEHFNMASKSDSTASTEKDTNKETRLSQLIHEFETSPKKPFLCENLTIATVADRMHLTTAQLSFYLNRNLDITFNTWINQLRINEAKCLMAENPELSISQIAYSVGFTDMATFSRTFKKIANESPSNYRRTIH